MQNVKDFLKPSILVLDDDPIMLLFLQEYLKEDYSVNVFADGLKAVEWLEQRHHVDAMLVDLNMPTMDGLSFLDRVLRIDHLAATPLLILSGSNKSADRVAGLRAGAVDFVTKPFNPDELRARLDIHLADRSFGKLRATVNPVLQASMN
jgi:putative two-component system response regulator